MSDFIKTEQVQAVLEQGMEQAAEILKSPDQMKVLLADVQKTLQNVPVLGTVTNDLPVMVMLVKSYVTKEYTNVSPKVIAAAVSAFLYLVKGKDLISDRIPVIGLLDDLAVIAVALQIVKPELQAYLEWKQNTPTA